MKSVLLQREGWVAGLRRFARPVSPEAAQCELCNAPILHVHQHLVEIASRKLLCSCPACALLFSNPEGTKFRRVPEQSQVLTQFRMTDVQWDALRIPINLAFFFRDGTAQDVHAFIPAPPELPNRC